MQENGLHCVCCDGVEFEQVYPATHSGEYRPEQLAITDRAYRRTGRLVRCCDCSMVMVWPRPSGSKLVRLYEELEDPGYCAESAGRRASFRRVLAAARALGPPNHCLLDVGAGTGLLLDEARQMGFDALGLEPSRWAARLGRAELGVNIIEGALPHPAVRPRSCGVVTLLDVIEHVDDPRDLLENAREVLADGGLLVVSTPDFASLARRLLGHKWWHCRLAHMHYFTPSTLGRLLRRCGFAVERLVRYGWTFSVGYWMSRLEQHHAIRSAMTYLQRRRMGRAILATPLRLNFLDSMTFFARPRGQGLGRLPVES